MKKKNINKHNRNWKNSNIDKICFNMCLKYFKKEIEYKQ